MAYSNNIGHSAVNGTSGTATEHNGDTSDSAPSVQASNGSRSVLEVTGDHARILKVLDHLRRLGLDQGPNAHSLPQIVVCGGQSSGKSSVLEAIAGIPFPRKSKLCTRYRTRVTLLRKPENMVVLKIIPENGRPSDEVGKLKGFSRNLDRATLQDTMPGAMDEAQKTIFSGSKENKVFTHDILSITISGPHEQELELLDLPGLISFDDRNDGNIELIRSMVLDEVQKPYSIVLAIAKATDDLQGHSILQMCKEHKVDRRRTLAVLTMPDQAPATRAAEYLNIMRGDDQQLKKTLPVDWHVLVNRDDDDLKNNSSTVDRDNKERSFFETQHPWNQVKPSDRGIANLRKRLSALLFAVARSELPKLAKRLRQTERDLQVEMTRLGGDLDETQLKRAFKHSTERLKKKARDHARGKYESDIYRFDGTHEVHLRSRVIEQGDMFRDKMLLFGHTWDLDGRVPSIDPDADLFSTSRSLPENDEEEVPVKSKEEAIAYFEGVIDSMRKKGLPGFPNEEVMNKVFWEISDKWERIAEEHINEVFECCARYFEVVTPIAFARAANRSSPTAAQGFGNYEVVAGRYRQYYLMPALEKLKLTALHELKKLEEDRMDTCQNFERSFLIKLRKQREQRGMKHTLNLIEKHDLLDEKPELDPVEIAKTLNMHTQERWTAETAEDLLGAVWAHYEVSIVTPQKTEQQFNNLQTTCERFIGNVLTMIVERHLMRVVEDIIKDELDVENLRELVKADEDVEEKKKDIRDQLEMITKSLAVLKPFAY
jgi:GTPase SAR1 family protein